MIKYNGKDIKAIKYNGKDIKAVMFNGKKIFPNDDNSSNLVTPISGDTRKT